MGNMNRSRTEDRRRSAICVDIWWLDSFVEHDLCAKLIVVECFESLVEVVVSTTLEANSDSWQIEIDENESYKTAILENVGCSQFFRMLFELKSSSAHSMVHEM